MVSIPTAITEEICLSSSPLPRSPSPAPPALRRNPHPVFVSSVRCHGDFVTNGSRPHDGAGWKRSSEQGEQPRAPGDVPGRRRGAGDGAAACLAGSWRTCGRDRARCPLIWVCRGSATKPWQSPGPLPCPVGLTAVPGTRGGGGGGEWVGQRGWELRGHPASPRCRVVGVFASGAASPRPSPVGTEPFVVVCSHRLRDAALLRNQTFSFVKAAAKISAD